MRTVLFLLVLFLSSVNSFAQNVGDYRSKNIGPTVYSWNIASSWEVWNGSSWVTATTYPGQFAGSYNVEIVDNHIISNPNTPNSFGVLTINGTLSLSGNGTPTFLLSASGVIVTPGAGLGYIDFVDNCTLALPTNSYISVFSGGLSVANPCSAGKVIKIGNANFATCNGGGQGDPVDFPTLTLGGGSINANTTIAPYQCFDDSVIITGSSSGSTIGTTITYVWKVTAPNGAITYPNGNTLNIPLDLDGIYTIELTYTANYTATNTNVVNTKTAYITSSVSTWNGTSWSPSAPDSTRRAFITSTYNTGSNGSFSACSLRISNGTTVTVAPNTYIETQNNIVNNGTLNIQNNGSLVQIDNAATFTGTGNSTVTRVSRGMKPLDYVYWGSPVFNSQPLSLAATTYFDRFYTWNITGAQTGAWSAISATPAPGNGYIARVKPGHVSPNTTQMVYGGIGAKLNSGTITVNANVYNGGNPNVDSGNSVLLANPYPSAINANTLFTNHSQIIKLLFWTSVTVYNGTGQYQVADYATYNLTGGTNPPVSAPDNGALRPEGYIASGQGFFAQMNADADIVFNNSMRVRANNTQFFRTADADAVETTTEIEKHRLWINLNNGNDAFRQMLVGYIEGATNGLDNQYDAESFTTNEIDIYTVLENKKLAIQGRGLNFTNSDVISIGYRVTDTGTYSITLNETDGLFNEYSEIYLKDKTTNTFHNLKEGSYEFHTQTGTFNDRFELRFTNETLSINNPSEVATNVVIYGADGSLHVNSKIENIESIELYDALGRQILTSINVQSTTFTSKTLNNNSPFLIARVTLSNKQVITKKIIIK